MNIKSLVGSGDRIGLFILPFLVAGLLLNFYFPAFFAVGGPPFFLRVLSLSMLIPGIIVWAWSVILILTMVPKRKLITKGPYALAKHPLYTGVALLVLPWAGFLLNTWLGAVLGIALYIGSRLYAPDEEEKLAKLFGISWADYCKKVMLPWL